MSKRTSIKTNISQAVDYWSKRIDECGLSVDCLKHIHIVGVAVARKILKDVILFPILLGEKMHLIISFCCVNVVMWMDQT